MSADPHATARPRLDGTSDESLGTGVSVGGLLRAAPVAALHVSYVLVAIFMLLSATLVVLIMGLGGTIGFDFRGTLWEPASAILNHDSPYPAAIDREVRVGNPALYPPLLMLPVVPLTLLPWWLGLTLWTAIGITSIVGAQYIVGIRDRRCYAVALLCAPTLAGLTWGNATLLLVPLVALAWRWRGYAYRGGLVLGVAIAAKLFLWPLVFWLLGTRRYRAAIAAAAGCCAAILVPWALIGFDGFASYADLLRVAEAVYATHSFSVATMLNAVGVDAELAPRGAVAVGLMLAVGAFVVGRFGTDEAAFSLAILAAILGSPIVWPYYYALLLVPVAIYRPRFSGTWALLGLFYIADRLPRPWLDRAEADPGGIACCPPDGVPLQVWLRSYAEPGLWPALAYALLAIALLATLIAWTKQHDQWRCSGSGERRCVAPPRSGSMT